jgi:hypothetical protein
MKLSPTQFEGYAGRPRDTPTLTQYSYMRLLISRHGACSSSPSPGHQLTTASPNEYPGINRLYVEFDFDFF